MYKLKVRDKEIELTSEYKTELVIRSQTECDFGDSCEIYHVITTSHGEVIEELEDMWVNRRTPKI